MMTRGGNYSRSVRVEISGIQAETEKAIAVKVSTEGTVRHVWLPKSQLHDHSEEEVWIPQWLAEEKDLNYE